MVGHDVSIPPARVRWRETQRGFESGLRMHSQQVGQERVKLDAGGSTDTYWPPL